MLNVRIIYTGLISPTKSIKSEKSYLPNFSKYNLDQPAVSYKKD